jgi:hypothetical protein
LYVLVNEQLEEGRKIAFRDAQGNTTPIEILWNKNIYEEPSEAVVNEIEHKLMETIVEMFEDDQTYIKSSMIKRMIWHAFNNHQRAKKNLKPLPLN